MTDEEKLAILKQVENIAALAGLRGGIEQERGHFAMGFDMGEGRSQRVFVRPSGVSPDGKEVVTILSPARSLTKGMFAGLSRQEAIDLLKLNENMYFARFGIWETEREILIVASIDAILESLDAGEFESLARAVTFAADGYEAKFGGDSF